MQISRISPLTNKLHRREINVTDDQLLRWRKGALAQDAFPNLDADDREFIISGITPEEWDKLFPKGDE